MQKYAPLLAVLCVIASIAMWSIGNSSTHLTELKDYFWVPLAPAIMFGLTALQGSK